MFESVVGGRNPSRPIHDSSIVLKLLLHDHLLELDIGHVFGGLLHAWSGLVEVKTLTGLQSKTQEDHDG
jgi:hypothetical protein